ncbi:FAD-dependent monooxygenase [Brachybacterium halotolerans subsp. kimchii]|uniref:FAD-dependent monooxygenase n=1 Tax=Brachybacterium halotolerans TaxID=2795215 RepID=UPI001E33F755|nr:FAD-dependent monooxygenase [Brachybacterium halotolerans]UEJ81812.1 FAD-dependent monooxygenase [Brachybacterium halotolerans subsp. kimchii]
MTDHDVDVLVAGAGPVGPMAAVNLARSGVSVRLVDAARGPATTSRALGAHARSLEVYDQIGILGEIAPHGTRVNAFVRHEAEGINRLDFDFGDLATRFPFMLNVDQVIIERSLRAAAAMLGVEIEWGTTLESFEQDADGVTAVLGRQPDPASGTDAGSTAESIPQSTASATTETVRARYLWGCDGGHSTVRKALDLPLTGESAHTWLIADAIVHTDVARDGVHWMFPEGGALMLFPFTEAGEWRLLDTTGEGDPSDPAQIARQFSSKLTQALDRETDVEPPSWVSRFTIQQRAVPAMHVGRCFVSGDAAHVHSPASGQGLNTGVQEAYNLAWKLAMVLHGQADAALLDTYDAERVPVGQALLASTSSVMATVMVDDPTSATAEATVDAERRHEQFERGLIRGMSGLAIDYSGGALTLASGESVPTHAPDGPTGPRPGERITQVWAHQAQSPGWTMLRAALRTPAWHLVVREDARGAADAAGLPDWLETVTLVGRDGSAADGPADPGAPHGATVPSARGAAHRIPDADALVRDTLALGDDEWILVRPDGYLSARGVGDEALQTALEHVRAGGRR